MDNLNFSSAGPHTNSDYDKWRVKTGNVFGVLDHNTVGGPNVGSFAFVNVNHSSYLGVGQFGDNSWAQPDSFGTNNTLYLENNVVSAGGGGAALTDCDSNATVQLTGGCRFAVRYNQLTNVSIQTHGTESTQRPRGARQAEIYGNSFYATAAFGTTIASFALMRSGVALNYNNTYSTPNGGSFSGFVELDDYRSLSGFGPWGACNGSGPYDQNDGTVYATGTITGINVNNGALTVTDNSQSWSQNQWQSNGSPYSIVITSMPAPGGGYVGWDITSSGSNSVTAAHYGNDLWGGGPPKSALAPLTRSSALRFASISLLAAEASCFPRTSTIPARRVG